MPLPVISFFLSLIGIVVLIGHKIVRQQDSGAGDGEHLHSHLRHLVSDLQTIKYLAWNRVKRFGYLALFTVFKFSIRSINFTKTKGRMFGIFLKKMTRKFLEKSRLSGNLPPSAAGRPAGTGRNEQERAGEKQEVSKYLQVIFEYRQKLRRMRHRIKEEEGIE